MLVRSGAVDVVVVDSVAALTPKAEIEGEMGDQHMGLQARLMSQALRKLTGNIKRSNTIVIFINQIRMKIGVMFGNPETTTGGNALKFYSSVRMDIRRIGAIKNGEEVVGSMTRVKVVKNKVAPPFRETEFEIMYGTGISKEGELIELGVLHNMVEKSGSWYSYKGERIGQGKDNARTFLQQHPEIAKDIEAQIRAKLIPGEGDHEPGRRRQRGVTAWAARRPNPSMRARPAWRRSMRWRAATTRPRIYAVNCSRRVTMRWSSRRCSKRCAPKNCSMIGATRRTSWPIMRRGARDPCACARSCAGMAWRAIWSRSASTPFRTGLCSCEKPGKRNLARRCRATTLTGSARRDSWVTEVSRALRFERP